MDYSFWDLNSLTVSELDEIIHLKKALSITDDEALHKWTRENPGRLKKIGEKIGNDFQAHDINENGVKELNGAEALKFMIDQVLNNNLDK